MLVFRYFGVLLISILVWRVALAADRPLDGGVPVRGASAEARWYYGADAATVAGTKYAGHGFIRADDGLAVDGWVEFDVAGYDRFTAQVGLDDSWPDLGLAGTVTLSVDSKEVATLSRTHGQAALPVEVALTGKSRLKIAMQIPVLLAAPTLGKGTVTTRVNPTDGAGMVWVPAGEFLMGSTDADTDAVSDEKPQRRVYLDGYWIYRHAVTVAQYRQFCRATGRPMPPEPSWGWQDTHPVVNVSWHDATAYAAWAGARLPTEAQWEKAARGTDGRRYPWGDTWDPKKCNWSGNEDGYPHTAPVGSYPGGASPYGALDMAGNVWEWCADWYQEDYYRTAPARNPAGPTTGTSRVLRGGSWVSADSRYPRVSNRDWRTPDVRNYFRGFRCVVPGRQ